MGNDHSAPFTVMMALFAVLKVLNFDVVHLIHLFFPVIPSTFSISKYTYITQGNEDLNLCYFIILVLTFRPMTYFEFIFVYGIKEESNFILL